MKCEGFRRLHHIAYGFRQLKPPASLQLAGAALDGVEPDQAL